MAKLKGLIVTLDEDYPEESYTFFENAIKMMKGVADVQPVPTEGMSDILIRNRTILTVRKAVAEVLTQILDGKIKLSE